LAGGLELMVATARWVKIADASWATFAEGL
jgi:hypothetical protein